MQQNTPEWDALRKLKIGASDIPIILGVSGFMTPLDLYLKKKDLPPRKPESDMEFIAAKGHYIEAKMRAEIELETGCDFPPEIRIHDQIDYLMASMDGFNEQWKMGIEVKYVGQDDYIAVALWEPGSSEPFPLPQYYPQIQQQYLCAGAKKMALIAATELVETEDDGLTPRKVDNKLVYILDEHGKKTYKSVRKVVPLNMEYINETLIPAAVKFQTEYIDKNIEPPATEADIIEIKNIDVGKKVTEYKKNQEKIISLKEKLKPLESTEKKLKIEIFKMELVNAPKMVCKGLTMTQGTKAGSIDYASAFNSFKDNLEFVYSNMVNENYQDMASMISDLKNVLELKLDNFKKANSTTYSIKLEKVKKPKKEKEVRETHKPIDGNIPELGNDNQPPNIDIKSTEIAITVETTVTAPEPETKVIKIADKKEYWKSLTPEQQTIQAESNTFKTEKGKSPRSWENKTREERIDYLRKLVKRADTHPETKKRAAGLADDLSSLP